MPTKLLTAVALFTFTATSAAMAQQTYGQDDQANTTQVHQITSTSWSSSNAQREQTGDLYQGPVRNSDSFGTTPQGGVLPGALNAGFESLNDGKQSDSKD